jgi:hypothetical protein
MPAARNCALQLFPAILPAIDQSIGTFPFGSFSSAQQPIVRFIPPTQLVFTRTDG